MSRHYMRARRLREARGTFRGASARVVDRVLMVTRGDGVEVVEDLRRHAAFDGTDDAALHAWRWVGRGEGVWWDDPDEGLEVRHMQLRSSR